MTGFNAALLARLLKGEKGDRILFVFVAEMSAHDARLQVLQSAQILDDVAASVIEEQFPILGAADRNDPFEIVPIFQQIIDGLRNSATRNYCDLRSGELFLFLFGHRLLIVPSGGKVRERPALTLRTRRRLSQ